ncbi:hypothetical protein DL771_000760 [Monosporascus sp. 5C6A]|nr:hypothetical protein DL771_000760 [Monosporascus sp. 5C6A]
MASSENDEKNPGARRANTGGVDNKTGEGSGQQATTAAADGTPASSAFTTAQGQEGQRQVLHQYLGQTLNLSQDENQQDQHRRDVNREQGRGQDDDGDDQGEEKVDDDKEADDENLLDRHNRTVAQILTRFRNVIGAATEPLPREGAVLEHAALNRFTMQTEMAALLALSSPSALEKPAPNLAPSSQITEIQNLLALNREIKALWIRGPLRKPGESDGLDAEIDRKSVALADMYQKVMDMFEEKTKAEARAGAGASSLAPGGDGKGKGVKGEEGVKES